MEVIINLYLFIFNLNYYDEKLYQQIINNCKFNSFDKIDIVVEKFYKITDFFNKHCDKDFSECIKDWEFKRLYENIHLQNGFYYFNVTSFEGISCKGYMNFDYEFKGVEKYYIKSQPSLSNRIDDYIKLKKVFKDVLFDEEKANEISRKIADELFYEYSYNSEITNIYYKSFTEFMKQFQNDEYKNVYKDLYKEYSKYLKNKTLLLAYFNPNDENIMGGGLIIFYDFMTGQVLLIHAVK